jgi:hypothetical protein
MKIVVFFPEYGATGSSKTLVMNYQTTWHRISKDSNLHNHHHENLKFEDSLNYENTKTVKTASIEVRNFRDV